jgi:hypothetical protein
MLHGPTSIMMDSSCAETWAVSGILNLCRGSDPRSAPPFMHLLLIHEAIWVKRNRTLPLCSNELPAGCKPAMHRVIARGGRRRVLWDDVITLRA